MPERPARLANQTFVGGSTTQRDSGEGGLRGLRGEGRNFIKFWIWVDLTGVSAR